MFLCVEFWPCCGSTISVSQLSPFGSLERMILSKDLSLSDFGGKNKIHPVYHKFPQKKIEFRGTHTSSLSAKPLPRSQAVTISFNVVIQGSRQRLDIDAYKFKAGSVRPAGNGKQAGRVFCTNQLLYVWNKNMRFLILEIGFTIGFYDAQYRDFIPQIS